MGLKEIASKSLFLSGAKSLFKNPGKLCLIVLFDLSFFLTFIFIMPNLAQFFAQGFLFLDESFISYVYFAMSVIYSLLMMFIYSFFKYGILEFIRSMHSKGQVSLKRLWKFYLLNLVIYAPPYIIFSSFISGIKEEYRVLVFVIAGVPLALFVYLAANFSQTLFHKGNTLKDSLKRCFELIGKFKQYFEIIAVLVLVPLALSLLFLIFVYLIKVFTTGNYPSYLVAYSYFKAASVITFDALAYFVVVVNRVSFYQICNIQSAKSKK
ncbi:MAG TPA: hypothetical protein VI564_02260 [Candidatus Nanoarchaeia archaeon]|nr:hypothetical protein [Candidatus Nanoarchaeia archaeon]